MSEEEEFAKLKDVSEDERSPDPCERDYSEPTPTGMGWGIPKMGGKQDEPFKRGRWGVPGTFKSGKGRY